MKRPFLLAAGLLALGAATASAQTGQFAAWLALIQTPVGALPAIDAAPTGSTNDRSQVWAVRATNWKFDGATDRNNTIAGSVIAPVGTDASFTATVGYLKMGSGDGTYLLGADYQRPLWESGATASNPFAFSIAGKGSAGYGHFTGGSGYNLASLAASLPVGARYVLSNKSALSVHVTPGYGFGKLSGGSNGVDNGSGTHPLIGFGGAFTTASGFGFHIGMQLVRVGALLNGNTPWTTGIAFSFPSS
jgi:hypothetical protein